MATPNKNLNGKRLKIAVVLGLVFVLAGAYVWITAMVGDVNNGYDHRYDDHPEAAIHISSNGDVTVPGFLSNSNSIQRNGNIYTLSGNLPGELIIERSNIVFDGKGFAVGNQNGGASNHQTIKLSNVNNVTLQDVVIKEYYTSLFLDHSSNNTITRAMGSSIRLVASNNNVVSESSGGVSLESSSYNTVINCSVGGGFDFTKSDYNSILYSNCTYQGRSLYFQDSSSNLVFGNSFWGIAWWINMYGGCSHNAIVGNDISMGPRYYVDSLTANNSIYHNNFLNFAWNHTLTTPVNVWSSGMRGNYWADYNGTDANHDGVGDTPYVIDATNSDNYP